MMRCRICGTKTGAPNWEARETFLWANQFGYAKRVFCKHCGAWTDQRVIYLSEDDARIKVVKEPTNPLFKHYSIDTQS
jgi:hypothetical protein